MQDIKKTGFSLIELLAVTAIISIIAGMIGVAAHTARQRAYATQARLEAQEVVTAFRSYWVAFGRWPDGFDGYSGPLKKENFFHSELMGEGKDSAARAPLLEISEEDFDESGYLDPWGNPYQLKIMKAQDVVEADEFQIVVSFVNAEKYYYVE